MNKLALLALLSIMMSNPVIAEDVPAYFKLGPLELNIPLKTVKATYLYNFKAQQNLVGAETPFVTLWNRVEGVGGAVTSLEGQGTPFVGGNILIGNLLDKYITIPNDFTLGGFGGWNFRTDAAVYGLKASVKIWG